MKLNDNTILRIKVPAHLYESVKAQLTINEAKQNFGMPGAKTVKAKDSSSGDKPKKTSAPKKANAPVRADGDHAPKADKDIKGAGMTEKKLPKDGHKKMGLEELKALAEMLNGHIKSLEEKEAPKEEMEEGIKEEKEELKEYGYDYKEIDGKCWRVDDEWNKVGGPYPMHYCR